MDQISTALISILCTLIGGATVAGIAYAYRTSRAEARAERTAMRDLTEACMRLVEGMHQYRKLAEESTDKLASVPTILDGIKGIAAEEVVQINGLRSAVKSLQGMIFRRDETRGVEVPSEDDKDMYWRVSQMRKENPGLSQQDAVLRVIQEAAQSVNGASEWSL